MSRSEIDPPSRRQILTGLAALGAGAMTGRPGRALAAPTAASPIPAAPQPPAFMAGLGGCSLTPSDVEGPFYLDLNLLRSDITEGKPGFPVNLIYQVRRESDCQPVQGAVVDVWQNDAGGSYSGFSVKGTLGETYLRGYQVTDAGGLVVFRTIYPGWYAGRTHHIHLKVILSDQTVLTTQTYFPQVLNNFVGANIAPYDQKGVSPTTNQSDGFYSPAKQKAWLIDPSGAPAIFAGNILVV